MIKVLIGCEESQAVLKEFRKLGVEAYSNDIIDCSGEFPQYHLKMDLFEAAKLDNWDLLIAFPPCTYLTVAGNGWIRNNPERWQKQFKALKFVYNIMQLPINHIAVENPVGKISEYIRPPDQIIHPYYFGDSEMKRTCLWLTNLPKLIHSSDNTLFEDKTHVDKPTPTYIGKDGRKIYYVDALSCNDRAKIRSKTFPGIARAMAKQWTEYILEKKQIECNK